MGIKEIRITNLMFFPSNILYSQCLYRQIKKEKKLIAQSLGTRVPTVISSETTGCRLRTIITHHYCGASDSGDDVVDGTFRGVEVLYKFYIS